MSSTTADADAAASRNGSAPRDRRERDIHPAAARMWRPEPEWVPPMPSIVELSAGLAGGVFGAVARPVIAGPVFGALAGLRPAETEPRSLSPEDAGDPGWFGPESVAWRVHADPSLLIAGVAAFTLQALHPLAMAGVAEHSAFSDDFLGRTRRTAQFVQGVVYGSSAQAERLCRIVRKAHVPVHGVAPDGRPYDANDPDLLDWVHIAEYLAIASANRRFGAHPMNRRDLDRYIAEVAVVGEGTGVPAPPRSWAELLQSLEHHRPNLAVGEYAAAGIAFLDDPPIIPGPAMPVWRAIWSGAIVCLPPVARRLLRLRTPSTADLAACRAVLRLLANLSTEPVDLAVARLRLGLS